MEKADVTFRLRFRILGEVHLLNSPLKVDVERRKGPSASTCRRDWPEAFVVGPSQC